MKLNKLFYFLILFFLLVPIVSSSNTTLNDFTINTSFNWTYNKYNLVEIYTFDIDNNLVEVDGVEINFSDDNLTFESEEIVRKDIGVYEQSFNIREQEINNLILNIFVQQDEKHLNKTFNIILKDEDFSKYFKERVGKDLESITRFVSLNWLFLLIGVFFLFLIWIVMIIGKIAE